MLLEILGQWLWKMFITGETDLVNPFCIAFFRNIYNLRDYVEYICVIIHLDKFAKVS